ncbi:minor histocompatibility antigen H13-like isoform X2 [Ptychodera flava]
MADVEESVSETIQQINETLNETATNATVRTPSTPEGMAIAYGSLVVMALVPIFFGAFRSVRYHKEQKGFSSMHEVDANRDPSGVNYSPTDDRYGGMFGMHVVEDSGETPEMMSSKDAAMFPIIASGTLLGIYIVFQIFSKEYINLLLTIYFFFLGVLALAHIISPGVRKLLTESFPNVPYHIILTKGSGEEKEDLMNYEFDRKDLVCLAVSSAFGLWYLLKKHWIANNVFGLAFAVNGVELLQLNTVMTGCILLGGLFVYDIFWVFATDVMVSVAKSFEAPIKLVFPQDLLEKGLDASNFAMLGLGDIVIPGIFIALLLRFDVSLNKNTRTYFTTSFIAYILGLFATIFVMHVFKHAQPALLYLVPACIGLPLFVALVKGELTIMFQ